MPWAQAQTRAGTLEFIRSARAQPERDGGFQLALVVDRRLAGVFGIHQVDVENRTTSIGYWLAARHEGAGLATLAARALVGHAFDAMGMHRVEIRAAPDNVRSRAIPERLGFSQEAVLRDAERFGDEYRDNILYAMLRARLGGAAVLEDPPERVEQAAILLGRAVADPDVAGPAERGARTDEDARLAERRDDLLLVAVAERRPRRSWPASPASAGRARGLPPRPTPARSGCARPARLRRRCAGSPPPLPPGRAALTLNGWRTASTAARSFGEQSA